MFGHIDDVKYQTGAATLRNFITTPQGAAQNRPGTALVRNTKGNRKARLIPFVYSTSQSMVLEMTGGDPAAAYNERARQGTIRFHTDGGTLLYPAGSPYGEYTPVEVATPWLEDELFDVHYVQSADVLTLVHPEHRPQELRRYGEYDWRMVAISFQASIAAPVDVVVTASPGFKLKIGEFRDMNADHNYATLYCLSDHNLVAGESVYLSNLHQYTGGTPGSGGYVWDGFYIVDRVPKGTGGNPLLDQLVLRTYGGDLVTNDVWTYDATVDPPMLPAPQIQYGNKAFDIDQYYRVTTIPRERAEESPPSLPTHVVNNLFVAGSSNKITWTAVPNAVRYNVYKRQSGLYGYIGQTEALEFTDDNIAPDMGITPPIVDVTFDGSGNWPGAVSYYEQRRCFAGTLNDPHTLWMTRTNTESDFSYSLPVKDTDRIKVRVAARDANTIQHIVPLSQLLMMTNAAEWRVSPVNSDAITPTTISVRPQSYVGASSVQPSLINNALVYCAARGGHVRELGYNWQASGFITGDLSLRATHLFDGFSITDMCYSKAPQPLVWFVRSDGKLLGLTYIPDEKVGAWHQHDTQGWFESCTTVPERENDVLYVVVKRLINGEEVRFVERMRPRMATVAKNAFFLDCGKTYDGTNLYPNRLVRLELMNVATGTYEAGSPLQIEGMPGSWLLFRSPPNSMDVSPDVGDAIVLTGPLGREYRLTIKHVDWGQDGGYYHKATVVCDQDIPLYFQDRVGFDGTDRWAFARRIITGLEHLNGATVSILADGAVEAPQAVYLGTVTLSRPAVRVHVGLPYTSDLQTLPMVLNVDGFGQGRVKNINKAWLRVHQSSGIQVGPDVDSLTDAKLRTTEAYGFPVKVKSTEIEVALTPSWAASGQILVRQSDPLPLTVVSITLEAVLGG